MFKLHFTQNSHKQNIKKNMLECLNKYVDYVYETCVIM
jgi:hypothetical protein